jgi:paraquat-inducible protein A
LAHPSDILPRLTACPHCDLLLQQVKVPVNHTMACPRCGYVLIRRQPGSLDKTLALCITGILLYLPAILLPLLTLEKLGMSEAGNVLQTFLGLYRNEYYFVSFMVLLSAVLLPALLLLLLLVVCVQLRIGRANRFTARFFRLFLHLEEWAMVEVYLLGILVTIFKMNNTTEIFYESGFFFFLALVFVTLGISAVCDRHLFWQLISAQGMDSESHHDDTQDQRRFPIGGTAAGAGLCLCLTCHRLQAIDAAGSDLCHRCGSILRFRKPGSITTTWALILTSAIFLIPANVLPIMEVDFLGIPSSSTIIDGIRYFFEEGAYLIGLIIFTASVLVPLFKIIGLIILLCTVHFKRAIILREKALMFRCIVFIGRWSMLDIFVIAMLSVLVNFGKFTSIHAAPAATYFCIVVAATMSAAIAFDPRIMWDRCVPDNSTHNHIL